MTIPAFDRAPFYVLGGFGPVHEPWVLGSYQRKLEAENAVRHQEQAPWAHVGTFKVCTFNEERTRFEPLTGGGVDFPLHPRPYTRESYAEAMRQHGIDPKHMR